MASSSVSQESLDMDDFDTSARRNRIRVHRGHSGRGSMPHRGLPDRGGDGGDQDRGDHQNGDVGDGGGGGGLGLSSHSHLPGGDHESPTRSAASRLKDKARSRPSHMKGKAPKDKRKLREKRRSTGVVHLPSTESTGDSLDDEDDDEDDTKKNTMYNEGSASSNHHPSSYEGRHSSNPAYSHPRRNKSPSDLEADLEDNQDYDSTVSHSETNLTLIGRSESSDMSQSQSLPGKQLPGSGSSGIGGGRPGGGFSSRYSPESNRALKFGTSNVSSDADSSRTNTPSTSSSSSILSRYREVESPRSTTGSFPNANSSGGGAQEPDSPRHFSNTNNTTTATTTDSTQNPPQVQPRPVGFSVFRDRDNTSGASGAQRSLPSYVTSASRFNRDRDSGSSSSSVSGVGSVHSRIGGYQPGRQWNSPSASSATAQQQQQQNEAVAQLEKQLEKERQDNKKLQQQLEEKDKKIAELEKTIELLNTECDGLDEDNLKLQEENKALIRAMSKLTSNV